ncbi:hypothetical protein [Microcoleus sp. B7-D4]|uniref:hypothetical protein n=1 Tax=Microcoleus sp. B7-D4 TaxID=2818696 RepID=UPI002FD6DD4C
MSLFFFNQSKNTSLSMTLKELIEKISKDYPDDKWIFYAMTCYFKPDIAKNVTTFLRQTLKNLSGVHILIDREEWIRNFIDIDMFVKDICERTGLPKDKISLTPIKASTLFHAKSYALISEEKINDIHQGFAIITSGNFTQSGFSRNLEIGQITTAKDSPYFLEEFIKIFREAKTNHGITNLSEDKELLFASKLLSLGVFYHQWDQSHQTDLMFRLTLSETEIQRRKKLADRTEYNNWSVKQSGILSDDPINIKSFFEDYPKPIPDGFLRSFSIETLLGKWVPLNISNLIEKELDIFVNFYCKILKNFIEEKLQNHLRIIEHEIRRLQELNIIKSLKENEVQEKIREWEKKVKRVTENSNLLRLLIWDYEKVNISISNLDMTFITVFADKIQSFYPKQLDYLDNNENLDKRNKQSKARIGVGKIISKLNWEESETINDELFQEKIDSAQEKLDNNKLGDLETLIKQQKSENNTSKKTKTNQIVFLESPESESDKDAEKDAEKSQNFVAILNSNTIVKGIFVKWEQKEKGFYYIEQEGGEEYFLKKDELRTFKCKKISK